MMTETKTPESASLQAIQAAAAKDPLHVFTATLTLRVLSRCGALRCADLLRSEPGAAAFVRELVAKASRDLAVPRNYSLTFAKSAVWKKAVKEVRKMHSREQLEGVVLSRDRAVGDAISQSLNSAIKKRFEQFVKVSDTVTLVVGICVGLFVCLNVVACLVALVV